MRTAKKAEVFMWLSVMGYLILSGIGCGGGGGGGDTGASGSSGSTPVTDTVLNATEDLPGVVITIVSVSGGTRADGQFQAGDTISVKFTVKKSDGSKLPIEELDYSGIMVSGPTFNYQRVMAYTLDWHTDATENSDGSYTYTFTTPIPSAYLAPINDSATYGSVEGELQGQALLAGSYTVGMIGRKNYTVNAATVVDTGNAVKDFRFGGASSIEARQAVKTDNCNQCHVTLRMHEEEADDHGARDARMCVLCHTSGAEDINHVAIDFRVMIHKIHNGSHLPSVQGLTTASDGTRVYGAGTSYVITDGEGNATDFSAVGFPAFPNMTTAMPRDQGYSALTITQKIQDDNVRKGVTECLKCHGDPDGSGPLSAPSQGDLYKAQPSRKACGSCHDDVDFTLPYQSNGLTMPANVTNSQCAECHASSGNPPEADDPPSVVSAHLHPVEDSSLNTGVSFDVTSVSGGTGGGGNFQAGDKPSITFTVKDGADADLALNSLDSVSAMVLGPTSNRQMVMAGSGPNVVAISPFDFSGRLQTTSSTNKGTMSKAVNISGTETLTVRFTGTMTFTVTGSVNGNLGTATMAATPSTNPSGSSVSAVVLTPTAVAGTVTVNFTSSTVFTVTHSVSGLLGTGTLAATTTATNRFTSSDGTLAFTITAGDTAFSAGNKVYLTLFKGAAAHPVIFAIVTGRTSFATNDRFYYELVAPAASYTYHVPMDMVFEHLGDATAASGDTFTAGNLPVYYGRQSLYTATLSGSTTVTAAALSARDRYIDITATAGTITNSDYIVIEPGAALGTREYAQVGYLETVGAITNTRLWLKLPLRYAHASGVNIQEFIISGSNAKLEGTGGTYTLNSATGTITTAGTFTVGLGVIMSYRTDGTFGRYRHSGDTFQATIPTPPNDSSALGQDWADWQGLSYKDGTYTADIYGSFTIYRPLYGETQTYTAASLAGIKNFLFGSASTIEPYALISSAENCNTCHTDVSFHGGSRRGFNTCIMCHGIAAAEDKTWYDRTTAAATTGVTINYRTMLHKIHKGEDLAFASTYSVEGNSSASYFDEIVFPAMPGGVRHCDKCHGTSDAWKEPSDRTHASQTTPTKKWKVVCNSCHDSTLAGNHMDLQTTGGGVETCELCHGTDKEFRVELMHKNR